MAVNTIISTRVTETGTEPVSIEQAKIHAAIDYTDYDSIVIGQAPENGIVGCNEVWIQGQIITNNNFGSNRFVFPTANYTAELNKDIIIYSGAGNATITLPPVADSTAKAFWVVKKGAGGTLRIEPYADELVDGTDHYNINNHQFQSYL